MDKSRKGFFVLLLASILNLGKFREWMYQYVHGDKESFWIANEILNVPYAWAPSAGGAIGYLNPERNDSICGGLFHVDMHGHPLWFNGGLQMNKNSFHGKNIMKMTHWAVDFHYTGVKWDIQTNDHPFCLKPADTSVEIGMLTQSELEITKMIEDEWLLARIDERRASRKQLQLLREQNAQKT